MLRKLGFTEIYEAVDGIDAVQKAGEINMKEQLLYQQHLKSNQPTAPLEIPNLLVLMDIWMPNMDGFEASKRILNLKCSSPSSSSVKIVAVSADVTRKALRKSVDVGMAGFMAKPYRMEELERVILELCVEWRK